MSIESVTSFEKVGTGLNVYESPDDVEGVVKWLETPEDVIAFATSGEDVSDVIVIARGGTTTFLTMALNAGIRGVVTLQGAPESHLGILCREYGIPCVMSVVVREGRAHVARRDDPRRRRARPARRLARARGHGQRRGGRAGRRLAAERRRRARHERGADGADPAAAHEVRRRGARRASRATR